MIPIREWTEYGDKLISPETATAAAAVGYKEYSPECFVRDEDSSTGQLLDSYTGLIGDGWIFICFRPTQSALQTWLRDKHGIYMYIKPMTIGNICDPVILKENGIRMQIQKTYEEALEAALLKIFTSKEFTNIIKK